MKINPDIKLEKTDLYNCLVTNIVYILRFLKRNYELLFYNSWGFSFSGDSSVTKIGNLVRSNRSDLLEDLDKILGVKMKNDKPADTEYSYALIVKELQKGNLLITYINGYWCSWHVWAYQRVQSPHFSIINGIEMGKKELYCTDPYFMIYNTILPFEEYRNGFGNLITYEAIPYEEYQKSKQVHTYGLESLDPDKISERVHLDEMDRFSNALSVLDLEKEVEGYEDPWLSPFFINLWDLELGRKQYSMFLNYINKNHRNHLVEEIAKDVYALGIKWQMMRNILYKAILMKKRRPDGTKIKKIISSIIEAERFTLHKVFNIKKSDMQKKQSHAHPDKTDDILPINTTRCIDLSAYYNNQSFTSNPTSVIRADLTGLKEFFIYDSDIHFNPDFGEIEKIIDINKMKTETEDNIICKGQVIPLDEDGVKGILLIGCAEFGNYSDFLGIHYKNGEVEQYKLELSDWYIETPLFGNRIFCTFKGGKILENDDVRIIPVAHLYFTTINFKEEKHITRIHLPVMDNMHIFSIVLSF